MTEGIEIPTSAPQKIYSWLVVSTHLKNISQIGSFPRVGVKIKKYIWNYHLDWNGTKRDSFGIFEDYPSWKWQQQHILGKKTFLNLPVTREDQDTRFTKCSKYQNWLNMISMTKWYDFFKSSWSSVPSCFPSHHFLCFHWIICTSVPTRRCFMP